MAKHKRLPRIGPYVPVPIRRLLRGADAHQRLAGPHMADVHAVAWRLERREALSNGAFARPSRHPDGDR